MMDSMTFDELDGIDSGRKKNSGRPAELKWSDERIIRVARGAGAPYLPCAPPWISLDMNTVGLQVSRRGTCK